MATMWASQVPSIKDLSLLPRMPNSVSVLCTESSLKLIILHYDIILENNILFSLLLPRSIKDRLVAVAKCIAMLNFDAGFASCDTVLMCKYKNSIYGG